MEIYFIGNIVYGIYNINMTYRGLGTVVMRYRIRRCNIDGVGNHIDAGGVCQTVTW